MRNTAVRQGANQLRMMSMRLFTAAAIAALAATAASAQTVTQRYPMPDGGLDYLSFDPGSHRVFAGRSDGVATQAASQSA